jgi:hypothetical protein
MVTPVSGAQNTASIARLLTNSDMTFGEENPVSNIKKISSKKDRLNDRRKNCHKRVASIEVASAWQ